MDRHAFATRDPAELKACESAGEMALRNAGWADSQADLAEISAPSAVAELMVLEALGIAGVGQGIESALNGGTAVNRSGGALPADPIMATGLFRLAAAAAQLRQGSGDARGIAHGAGGVGLQNNIVMTLEV
jgi:acetyl-CoA C-acetyltransferase